jgi:hypothetical protein
MPFKSPDDLRTRAWELARVEDNPYQVAVQLRQELATIEELNLALTVAFGAWVRHVLTQRPPIDSEPHAEPKHTPPEYDNGFGGKTPNPTLAAGNARYLAQLRVKIRCGERQYKALGDTTAAELRWAADVRRGVAEQNLAAAHKYEKLAAALSEANAATVADLDPEIGEAILLSDGDRLTTDPLG